MDSSTPLDQLGAVEQRAILAARGVSAENLDRLAEHVETGTAVDGYKARPVVPLPTSASPIARDVTIVHDLASGQRVVYADDVVDTQTSGDAIAAAADGRRAARAGDVERFDEHGTRTGVYDGLAEVARGTKVAGQKRNDPVGRAKPLVGETQQKLFERFNRHDSHRTGRQRPALVGARVTHEAKAALDADPTASNGELMDAVGIVMMKTSRSKRDIVEHLERIAESGMLDPEIMDALPEAEATGFGRVA